MTTKPATASVLSTAMTPATDMPTAGDPTPAVQDAPFIVICTPVDMNDTTPAWMTAECANDRFELAIREPDLVPPVGAESRSLHAGARFVTEHPDHPALHRLPTGHVNDPLFFARGRNLIQDGQLDLPFLGGLWQAQLLSHESLPIGDLDLLLMASWGHGENLIVTALTLDAQ